MAGTDIGASLALSSSSSATGTQNAGTTFNFASPNARGDVFDAEVNPSSIATATATTAKGDGAQANSSTPVSLVGASKSGFSEILNKNFPLVVGVGGIITIAVVAALIVYAKRN